jgi:hypothetical protein
LLEKGDVLGAHGSGFVVGSRGQGEVAAALGGVFQEAALGTVVVLGAGQRVARVTQPSYPGRLKRQRLAVCGLVRGGAAVGYGDLLKGGEQRFVPFEREFPQPPFPAILRAAPFAGGDALRALYVTAEPLGHVFGLADVVNEPVVGGEEGVDV